MGNLHDIQCKIKKTLLIQDLKPTLNKSVDSEQLFRYNFTLDVVYFVHCSLARYQYLALVLVF